jgi:hypothetical protein
MPFFLVFYSFLVFVGIVGPACPEPDHGVDGCWVKSDVIGIIKHDNLGTLYVCYDQSPHPKLSIVTDCGLTGDTNHPQTITSYHLVNISGREGQGGER